MRGASSPYDGNFNSEYNFGPSISSGSGNVISSLGSGLYDLMLGQPAKQGGPYQGPQFGLQQQIMSSGMLASYLAQNPYLAQNIYQQSFSNPNLRNQLLSSGLLQQTGKDAKGNPTFAMNQSLINASAAPSFTPGQYIQGIQPTTSVMGMQQQMPQQQNGFFPQGGFNYASAPGMQQQSSPQGQMAQKPPPINPATGQIDYQKLNMRNQASKLYAAAMARRKSQSNTQGQIPTLSSTSSSGQPMLKTQSYGAGQQNYGGSTLEAPTPNTTINPMMQSNTTVQPQLTSNTSINPMMQSNTTIGTPKSVTGSGDRYSAYQFQDPGTNFAQRSAYQFQGPQAVNVADIYTPQMQMAQRSIEEQSKRTQEQQLSDLNRRGLLTSGAATKALDLQRMEQDRKLADLSSQYSIEQGRAQLQEDQMRRQMEQERQVNQAAELFRQSGATDEQAMFLANQNFNRQQAQAGQNISAFGANLGAQQQQYGQDLSGAQMLMGQQAQAFGQNLSGQQNLMAQQNQAFGQNLSGQQNLMAQQGQAFNQGLSGQQNRMAQEAQRYAQLFGNQNLQMQQQGQLFNQQLQGRQQGIDEYKLYQAMRNAPYQNLYNTWTNQVGGIPSMDAQGGILGPVAGAAAGAAMAGAFCLPKGTQIELEDGSTVSVEDVRVGDIVKGGKVIATQSLLRKEDHRFSLHKFKGGKSVVMTSGHPAFDAIESKEEVGHDSKTTNDILTDSGWYIVNGVRLGSTIKISEEARHG